MEIDGFFNDSTASGKGRFVRLSAGEEAFSLFTGEFREWKCQAMINFSHELPKEDSILVVEDDEALALLIKATLLKIGYSCALAATGEEAMVHLSVNSPAMMLLDHSLPDMTGLDLVSAMDSGRGGVPPYVVITGTEDARLAVNIMKHGARDLVVKDREFIERLPAVVSRVMHEAETDQRLKTAEKALRDSEQRLAKAQKIARMGSWEWNPVSGKFFCSLGLANLAGLSTGPDNPVTVERISDCIHPDDYDRVKRAIEELYHEGRQFNIDCRLVCQDGAVMYVNAQGDLEFHADGTPHVLTGTVLDISARKRAEQEIQQLAYYDTLTGLPNRTLLKDRLSQAIAQAHRDDRLVAVLFLDLDQFKSVNDTLGHQIGDRLLQVVAERLTAVVRESDSVSRIGGDEFVIILNAINQEEDVSNIAGMIIASLAVPVRLDEHEIFTSGSVGIALFPMDGDDGEVLMKNADLAMYRAKELDKNNYQFFSKEMNQKIIERHVLEAGLRRALERSEFSLRYQPQVSLDDGRLVGMEALLRWHHPEMGMIQTETFIPLAEETGLILPIGEWVLRTACARNKAWQDAGHEKVRVAINLSPRQFKQKNLVAMISATLAETGLAPEYLELELTESTIMANIEEASRVLSKLKEIGVSLSVDDFGTGYSSLRYLKRFAIDRLKIDRSLVQDVSTSYDVAAVAEAIIAMGHSLRLKVIAEGVEQKEQLDFLKSCRCDEMQGFLRSRPLTEDDFTQLLEKGIFKPF